MAERRRDENPQAGNPGAAKDANDQARREQDVQRLPGLNVGVPRDRPSLPRTSSPTAFYVVQWTYGAPSSGNIYRPSNSAASSPDTYSRTPGQAAAPAGRQSPAPGTQPSAPTVAGSAPRAMQMPMEGVRIEPHEQGPETGHANAPLGSGKNAEGPPQHIPATHQKNPESPAERPTASPTAQTTAPAPKGSTPHAAQESTRTAQTAQAQADLASVKGDAMGVLPTKTAQPPEAQEGTASAAAADTPPRPPEKPQLPPPPKALSDDEVTAATAAQWKFKAVPPDTPDQSEPYISRAEEYAASRVIGARVRGKKHKHEGTPCDDWFETAQVGDMTLIAVSDGAGSRKFSRVGSRAACERAIQYLSQELASDRFTRSGEGTMRADLAADTASDAFQEACGELCAIVQNAIVEAEKRVAAAYEERREKPEYANILGRDLTEADLGCTLLLAVVIPLAGREHLVISCQVGDGAIVMYNTRAGYDTAARELGQADSGEFSGETEFITSPHAVDPASLQQHTKVSRNDCDLVMVMTDGVSDDYYPNKTSMPMLLYDLAANGILSAEDLFGAAAEGPSALVPPEPVEYPWVDNPSVVYALQYANRICETLKLTPEELWQHPEILREASGTLSRSLGQTQHEQLCRWLDNYVRRGSFDDRTLVIAQLKETQP